MTDQIPPHDPQGTPGPSPDDREPLELALIEKARDLLRHAARGNGIPARHINVTQAEGQVLNFEGLAFFTVEVRTGEKRGPGKEQGQVVGSATELRQKIKNEGDKAASNPEVRRHTIQMLKKRKDLGVLISGQYMSFAKLGKKFVVHDACGSCGRDGKISCTQCGGQRRIKCRKCFGTKQFQCPICRGNRTVASPQGQKNCGRCHGHGHIKCPTCKFTGFEPCPQCRGQGAKACQNCNGTGWNSLVGTLEIKAKSRFEYDRTEIPPAVQQQIDALGPQLVIAQHATANIIEDEERFKQLDAVRKDNEYIVPYHIRLPVGALTFSMPQGKEIKGSLFGYTPLINDLPTFLEAPLHKALSALDEAAAGRIKRLRDAMQARFVSEMVMAELRYPQKKALKIMGRRYPFGISAAKMLQAALSAQKAINHVIRKPRLTGMALGALLAAALYGGYLVTAGRGMLRDVIGAQGLPAEALLAGDALVFAAGWGLAIITTQMFARHGLKSALGKAAARIPPQQLSPAAGGVAMVALVITLLLFAGGMEAALRTGRPAPSWYTDLRGPLPAASLSAGKKQAAPVAGDAGAAPVVSGNTTETIR